MTADTVTDTAKDIAKYVARIPPTLKSTDADTSDTPENSALAAAPQAAPGKVTSDLVVPKGETGSGRGNASGIDPSQWHNQVLTVLALEESEAHHQINEIEARATAALEADSPYVVDFDLLAAVRIACKVANRPLADLDKLEAPSALD